MTNQIQETAFRRQKTNILQVVSPGGRNTDLCVPCHSGPSGEKKPHPQGQPPPPHPPVHRGMPPLDATEVVPSESTATVPPGEHEEQTASLETVEAPANTQDEHANPQGAEGEPPPVPPRPEENQPGAEETNVTASAAIIPVPFPKPEDKELAKPTQPSPNQGQENPHDGSPTGPPPAPPKVPHSGSTNQTEDRTRDNSSPVPIPSEHSDEARDADTMPPRELPQRIKLGYRSGSLPTKRPEGSNTKPRRSQSDNYNRHRKANPAGQGAHLFNHRLLTGAGSATTIESEPAGPSGGLHARTPSQSR